MQLSLIVCTRNRAARLARCLASLRAQETEEAWEAVLVDNGSRDGTPATLTSFAADAPFPVRRAWVGEPNLSRARNAGWSLARGAVLAFSDDDCVLAPDYVTRAVAAFASGGFGYAGGRIRPPGAGYSAYACDDRLRPARVPPGRALRPGSFQGANLLFRREVLVALGGFDPELGTGAAFRCEDIDICARASLAGQAGAYLPEVVVTHHHGRRPGPTIAALERENAHARGAYYAKFLLRGHPSFLADWAALRLEERDPALLLRELVGALHYGWTRLRRARG